MRLSLLRETKSLPCSQGTTYTLETNFSGKITKIKTSFIFRVEAKGKGILQHHQIIAEFEALPLETQKKLEGGAFFELLRSTQEAIVLPPWVALAVRPRPGVWEHIRVNLHALVVEELQASEYLHFKEELVDGT